MNWLQQLARPRFILVSLAVVVLCESLFVPLLQALRAQGVPTTLDLMVGFSYPEARAHLALYTDSVKSIHGYFRLVDLVFPFAYGLFFASLLTWLLGKIFPGHERGSWLGSVPLVTAACDLAENAGILAMVQRNPAPFEAWARFTSVVGVVKILGFYASLLAVVVLTVVLIGKRVRARRRISSQ